MDLDHGRGSLLVRHGNGTRRRETRMDEWACEQLQPWIDVRLELPEHAVEMAHEGVPLIVIQRPLGHSSLGITSIYLQGVDNAEIIDAVHARRRAHGSSQRLAPALTMTGLDAPHRAKPQCTPRPFTGRSSSRKWTSPDTIGADELSWRGVLAPMDRALDQALVGQPRSVSRRGRVKGH